MVCSLSLCPVGKASLTKPDWHCQELYEQSDCIYIRVHKSAELLHKSFFVGKPHPQQSQRSQVGLEEASFKVHTHKEPNLTERLGAFCCLVMSKTYTFITRELLSNKKRKVFLDEL